MQGYVPGKQPLDGRATKLNTNENPYPTSPHVMGALATVTAESLRKYPPPMADAFREVAASLHRLSTSHVIATNGGDELLRLALTTFVEPGRPIGVLEPSYSLYPVLADIHDCPVVRVNADSNYDVPSDFATRMNDAGVQLTLLVNPHAPSGALMSVATLVALAAQLKGVLLVDEAYVDFVDPDLNHDLTPHVTNTPNLLLLRTMSKGYSLAGLRFGYGLGHEGLIAPMLNKTRDSYNVDAIAQRLATAALEDQDYARSTWDRVRSERARVTTALRDLNLSVPASQSNFLLATVAAGKRSASQLRDALEEQHGLLVRYFDEQGLRDKLRITVGTPEQNDRLLGALAKLL
jgi:histidinol-phosphate aminotransferase